MILFNSIEISVLQAEIKYKNRDDMVIVKLPENSTCAGVFTKNAFTAAPVQIAKKHLKLKKGVGVLVVNSGNANAATGEQGLKDAEQSCELVASLYSMDKEKVLPFSTGVIGELLPMDKIEKAVLNAKGVLGKGSFVDFAKAIMTTDTFIKLVEKQVEINGEQVNFIGVAKGAGMICPNMATTLAFVFTDAKITNDNLQTYLYRAIEPSFNSISVDGDTSTNDSAIVCAIGEGVQIDGDNLEFEQALTSVFYDLALMVAKDGEGATKLIHINVAGAKTESEAKAVGYSIANSPLVKTAFFAADPNWGRLVMAVGKAEGMEDLDTSKVDIKIEDRYVVQQGGKSASYDEEQTAKIMQADEFNIFVELGRGDKSRIIHTCDLSFDYVKINAEYRS